MEGSVGKALHQARLQQKLTVEEVARGTKIRPARIVDLENDDYMHFPNLAYARSFLVLYAKYLRVDITKYPTVEVGSSVGTGDYQYLRGEETQTASHVHPEPAGPPEKPRWLIAFFVFLVMAVLGVLAGLFFMNFMRLGSMENLVKKDVEIHKAPALSPSPTPVHTPSPTPSASPLTSTGSEPVAVAVPVQPSTAEGTPVLPAEPVNPAAATASPGVRRAEALISGSSDAEILAEAAAAAAATPTSVPEATPAPQGALHEIKISVTRKTKIKVVRDNPQSPSLYLGFVNPLQPPLIYKGSYFWIKTSDPGALKVTIDGRPATGPESGVEIQ